MRRSNLIVSCALLGLTGCPDEPTSGELPMGSGFAEDSEAGHEQGTHDPPTGSPRDTDDESGEPWAGTAFVGDIRAVLTVTFTPAHALDPEDDVGLAGGYRIAEVGWAGAEDLYSPVAYQLALPTPPDEPDTLVPAESLSTYDWGSVDDWLVAGNGMKLRQGDGGPELPACLLPAGTFPVYRSSSAMGVAPECAASTSAWTAATPYDVVLYGGELFQDNVLPDRITTPTALVVTAPDLDQFDAPLASDQDLAITWEAGDDPEARVIIRVIDTNGNVITVHAGDDGSFTIPAAELGALVTGPVDLSIARERSDRVQFTDGGLTVLGRYERWGFFDLY